MYQKEHSQNHAHSHSHSHQIVLDFFKTKKKIKNPFAQKKIHDPSIHSLYQVFGFLTGMFSLVFGIIFNAKGCGAYFIAFQMFGVLVAGTVVVRWVVDCIQSIRTLRIIYSILGLLSIIASAVSIGYCDYLQSQYDGVYCEEYYCHNQVNVVEYFDMVRQRHGKDYLDQICTEMKKKYGSLYHEKIRESVLQGLYIYQYNRNQGKTFEWSLEMPDFDIKQILIITISALELVYAILLFYHSWRIKTFKITKLERNRKKSKPNTPKKYEEDDQEELELDNLLRKKRNKPLIIKDAQIPFDDTKQNQDELSFRANETEFPLAQDKNPHDFSYYENKPMEINELPNTKEIQTQNKQIARDIDYTKNRSFSRDKGTQDQLNISDDEISQRIDSDQNEISFGEQNNANDNQDDDQNDAEFLP